MSPAEKQQYVNRLESEIEQPDRLRIELLRDIVACLAKVVDAIPPQD
jgi:hypothetical protein